MSADEFTILLSENLNLTLENEQLSRANAILKQKMTNQEIELGKLKIEKLKVENRIKQFKEELDLTKSISVSKIVLSEHIPNLISFLVSLRKKSQEETERQTFEKYIEILGKINV